MSYHTEKTLSSIRSLVDEWSIRKEGGKQSFFVLKEIDKLLSELNDAPPSRNELVDRLESVFAVNRQQEDTIDELNDENNSLRETINQMAKKQVTLKAELSARKEDSKVLMQVVEAVKIWDEYQYTQSISQIANIVEDYLDAPEGLVVTLKPPSMGTRVVSKNEEAHVIDEAKMEAVRMLVGSDMWVLHTDEEAVEDKQQKETIDELRSTYRAYRDEMCGKIKELTHDLDARNTVIKDFKAIETKETDRLHETIEGNGKIIDELNDMYCDVCGKLERIEKISKKARTFGDVINRVSANHIAIDEINTIIQEE